MNEISRSDSYAAAGVDITAGYRAVELMKQHIARTMTQGVLARTSAASASLFELDLDGHYRSPMLVSGTDGVGTKLKIAFLMDKHDTVGIDCVAMCVNDIICCGAKPLFFLDYIACGKNVPEKHRGHRLRRGGGLRSVGLRAHRRRNGGNARLLSRRRIRSGGLLAWAWWIVTKIARQFQRDRSGRCADRR